MIEQSFKVAGLHCSGCIETVTDQLAMLGDVRVASVELDVRGLSTIRIESGRLISSTEVQSALRRGGNFEVRS